MRHENSNAWYCMCYTHACVSSARTIRKVTFMNNKLNFFVNFYNIPIDIEQLGLSLYKDIFEFNVKN